MIDNIRGAFELLKEARSRADGLYAASAAVAAYVTITALVRDERPLQLVAAVCRELGWERSTRWLTIDGPPVVMFTDSRVQAAAVNVVWLTALAMVLIPLLRGGFSDQGTDLHGSRLVGSRIGSTAWVLALLATQWGEPRAVLDEIAVLAPSKSAVVVGVVVIVLLALLNSWSTRRLGISAPVWRWVLPASKAVAYASFALVLVPIGPLLGAIAWLFALQPQWLTEVEVARALDHELPPGASPVVMPPANPNLQQVRAARSR